MEKLEDPQLIFWLTGLFFLSRKESYEGPDDSRLFGSDSVTRVIYFSRVTSDSISQVIKFFTSHDLMTRDFDDPINKYLINFVLIYQSDCRFPVYIPSDDLLMIRESSSHETLISYLSRIIVSILDISSDESLIENSVTRNMKFDWLFNL